MKRQSIGSRRAQKPRSLSAASGAGFGARIKRKVAGFRGIGLYRPGENILRTPGPFAAERRSHMR